MPEIGDRPLAVKELLKKAEAAGLTVSPIGVQSVEVHEASGTKVASFFWQPLNGDRKPRVYLYVDGNAYIAAYSHVARKFDELGEARQKEDDA